MPPASAQTRARVTVVRNLLRSGEGERALAMATAEASLALPGAADRIDMEFAPWPRLRARWLQAVVARFPQDPAPRAALAAVLQTLGHSSAALDCCEAVLARWPEDRATREVRALALIERGDVETGLASLRELVPGNRETAARHLVVMHYDPTQSNDSLFAALNDFGARHLRRFGPPYARHAQDPQRRLRIGWLSPRLSEGPVARFLEAPLRAFDRTGYEHLLLALQPLKDEVGHRLAKLADRCVLLPHLDDEALLSALRELELDVLFDLAGHATANRLEVIAQRVAPLQISWLDWFNTTAAPNLDAWFSDPWLTPADSSQAYTENLLHLPAGRFCYSPLATAPAPDHDGAAPLVFASFNRLAKLNDTVVAAWSRILLGAPGAQLELRARMLEDPATQTHLQERFAKHGVEAQRLRLHASVPYRDLLTAYAKVDIVLDPFPFSGCTTTCDALWMGCPVVTLEGETLVSRQSASLLQRLGRTEWIATSIDDYVSRALVLAVQVPSLRTQRVALRAAVLERLCDADSQAHDMQIAIRQLWQKACA